MDSLLKKTAEKTPYRNIKHLRERGYTGEEIGERVGLTKQRVFQIINEYYPGTKPIVISEEMAAKTLGTTKLRLFSMRQRGEIHPLKRGVMYRYSDKILEEARKALKKACAICGDPVPPGNRKYCQVCSEKMSDPKQVRDLPGMGQKHNGYIRRYRKKHKEQVRESRRKSDASYNARVSGLNFKTSVYAVRTPHPDFGLGEQFKVVECKDNKFVLSDGRMIPSIKTVKLSGARGNLNLKVCGV